MATAGPHLRIPNEEKVTLRVGVDTCNLVRTIVDFGPGIAASFTNLCTYLVLVLGKPKFASHGKWHGFDRGLGGDVRRGKSSDLEHFRTCRALGSLVCSTEVAVTCKNFICETRASVVALVIQEL